MTGLEFESHPSGVELTPVQRLAWLRLIRSENVGPATFRDLLNHFGAARAALEALPELAHRGGRRRIKICPVADAEAELERAEQIGARYIAMGEPGYPMPLAHIDAAPPLIAVRGTLATLTRPTIAIVGSRNCSIAGRKFTARIAGELGRAGYVVVSGLARGIDGAAHTAALENGTIAVLAGGIDHVYPPEHADLIEDILTQDGALVSEMPLGWVPRGRDFPRRNRLISGLSLGVIVVEAAMRSGSLHTARFAAEQGREVFVVPGSPLEPRSVGCNRLIQDGATLITGPDEVIAALDLLREAQPPTDLRIEEDDDADAAELAFPEDHDRQAILSTLGMTAVEVDEIIRDTGLEPRLVHLVLLELEIAGRLERHGRQLVSIIPDI
jgi:DNA processing protein